jgi:hypothetical protein
MISIQEVCDRWEISRPTVMKAIAERKLIGEKQEGKWFFEPASVVRWRGEPRLTEADHRSIEAEKSSTGEPSPTAALLKMAEDYISSLKEQLEVKDRQLAESQETMREQMRLLTYAGPALSNAGDEVAQLKAELAKKDQQMEKLAKVTAEKVAQLVKGQRRVARPKVVTAADMLKKDE